MVHDISYKSPQSYRRYMGQKYCTTLSCSTKVRKVMDLLDPCCVLYYIYIYILIRYTISCTLSATEKAHPYLGPPRTTPDQKTAI